MKKRGRDRLTAFEPVADQYSKVLILGSMPGTVSLEKQEYYAFAQNAFWEMVFSLFGQQLPILKK